MGRSPPFCSRCLNLPIRAEGDAMNITQYANSIFHSITPKQLSAFLSRKGWQRVKHPNAKILVFEGESLMIGQVASVVFPSSASFSDYFARLNDTLRLLSKHFNMSLSEVIENIAHCDHSIITDNYINGFSGNMCEILTDIYDSAENREINHSIVWASDLTPPGHLENPTVQMTEKSYEVLKIASADLQTVNEPDEEKTVIGRITQLKSKVPPIKADEFAVARRIIVISWEVEKQTPINIHIKLPLEQYRWACDAHKNGHKIKVTGKPEKHGKLWHLLEHHGFKIISADKNIDRR